jgi:hypothetical protein
VGVTLVAGAASVAACEPQTDAQPTVASVNFEPRLVVTVGDTEVTAAPGDRDGAEIAQGDDTVDWTVPAGSVVEVHNDASVPRRFVITRASAIGAGLDGAPVWIDTGEMQPRETIVLGLSALGDYGFAEAATGTPGAPDLTIRVTPHPSA